MGYCHILASFEKLNPFNKLNSKCQYNSIKKYHSNKNLNTRLSTICKAGAIIEMPFQILSLNISNFCPIPSLFKHVLFLHFKLQVFTIFSINFMAGLFTIILGAHFQDLINVPRMGEFQVAGSFGLQTLMMDGSRLNNQ